MSPKTPTLKELGWTPELTEAFKAFSDKNLIPARVVAEHRSAYDVVCANGAYLAEISGVFRREARSKSDFPAVGDWAAVSFDPRARRQTIQGLLPRKTRLSRRNPGGDEEQIIAANIDTVFIVQGLDGDYNLKRLERYLAAVRSGGAAVAVILNKTDLAPDAADRETEIRALGFDAPVLPLDSINKTGYEGLAAYITAGSTIVLVGSSGAGKSTIINNLMGSELQRIATVREDDSKGRHTTTGRKLFILPGSGALLIDTPGMRGLELWADGKTVDETFEDIQALAAQCRFGNCSHSNEPACAVRGALEGGQLDRSHYENYLKIRAESAFMKSKVDLEERLKRKNRAKDLSKHIKNYMKRKLKPD
jgi:ribosome biogenesis GTPase